jgi:hypothetical protein
MNWDKTDAAIYVLVVLTLTGAITAGFYHWGITDGSSANLLMFLPALVALGLLAWRRESLRSMGWEVGRMTSAHEDIAQQLGAASPQAESIAYYLASALVDLHRYPEAADLLPPLTEADLAAAEPRPDWGPRLQALRAEILIGQGQKSEGVAQLTQAVAQMQSLHTPIDDIDQFNKLLVSARKR